MSLTHRDYTNPADEFAARLGDYDRRLEIIERGHTHQSIGNPAGTVIMFAGPTAPLGWLVCNGQLVSRTTYSNLFATIGTAFGVGDGSTTFALPNMSGRFPTHGTPGVTGGGSAHSHTLAAGYAQIMAGATAAPNAFHNRIGTPSWTPTIGFTASSVLGAATPQVNATALGGSTDANANTTVPQYTSLNFLIKY